MPFLSFSLLRKLLAVFLFPLCCLGQTQEEEVLSSAQTLGSNPLKGLNVFAINAAYVPSAELQKEINEEVVKTLEKIGNVEKLEISSKDLDQTMQNLALIGSSEARLVMKVDTLVALNETPLPVVEASLCLNTGAMIKTTGIDSIINAWCANAFIQGGIDKQHAKEILSAVKGVVAHFVKDYQAVNEEASEKPTFYLYADGF